MRRQVEEYVKTCHACERLKLRHELKVSLGDVMEPTREMDNALWLENPKAKLRTVYKQARVYGRNSHATNQRYYDRSGREREFALVAIAFLNL
jgi:hypothetical protein